MYAGIAILLIALVCAGAGLIPVEKTEVLWSASTTKIYRRKVFSKIITPGRDYLIEGSFQSSATIHFAVMTEDQYYAWGRRGHPDEGIIITLEVASGTFSFDAQKGIKYRLVFVNFHYYSVTLSTPDITGKYTESYNLPLGVAGLIGVPVGAIIGAAGYRMKPPEHETPPPSLVSCPKCGAPITDPTQIYCSKCGNKIR